MAKLYFIYSAMNAGKSTTLLQSSFNYRERGMRTILMTAAIDNRAGAGVIASRIGLEGEAIAFAAGSDLYSIVEDETAEEEAAAIFVDESQFLTKDHVFQLACVADQLNIPVLCYGLRTDFKGELFEGSQWLMALADELRELKTICKCGRKATMNLRVDPEGNPIKDGEKIVIGGNERYVPLCRKHFFEKLWETT